MRAARELTIRGEPPQLERLLERVEGLLRDGWRRDRKAEERLGRLAVRGPLAACFTCTASGDRPAAGLWIHARGPGELYVSNVVLVSRRAPSDEDSRRVLEEFHREFLRPAASELGVEVETVLRHGKLEDELSPEAVRLLRAFSAAADRSSPHPEDRPRWNAFLIQIHCDEAPLAPSLLDEWLKEEGWPQETRRQLVDELEAAQSLLAAYDEEAPRR